VRLRPEEYDWLVNILLMLGIDATVLAPEELRLRVRQKALEIAHHSAE
jgi:predicted DNA-binding transcriptional regulator YafY